MSRSACLGGTGLAPADLADPELSIVAGQELSAIRNFVTFTGDAPGLGTEAGHRFQLGTLGVYGLAMMSSRTVRELVGVARRQGFGKFSWGMLDIAIAERDFGVRVRFDETSVPADVRNFVIERDLAFTMAVLDLLIGPRPQVVVATTLPERRAAGLRDSVGRHRLVTEQAQNVVTFAAAILDDVLPHGDQYAAAMCERQCEELLQRATQRDR